MSTDCDLVRIEGTADYHCLSCGRVIKDCQYPIRARCPAKAPRKAGTGPGTAIAELIGQLGIQQDGACGCDGLQMLMDAWGVDGCRLYFNIIHAQLKAGYAKLTLQQKAKAARRAITLGIARSIDPRDPALSLFELAMERAARIARTPSLK